ncbi:putative Lipopolysaccharide biosynthesis protein [Candidatus Zixiibacteriota bacterium]|nr:putative Lipopolysaccharide biosynthesis protein [candidate division Zixibacteria bacterium]
MDDKEFNLWKILEVIALRIKFIIIFVITVAVISAIISLLLPRWYRASTLLLPPKEESMKLGQSTGIEDLVSITSGLVLPIRATPSDVYARILRSRAVAEKVMAANKLKDYYHLQSDLDLFKRLENQSEFRVTDEGLLQITYSDRNPAMAAQIANSYADELDKLNREVSTSRARTARDFISGRLAEVSRDLDSARLALKDFQDKYKAIDLDQQTQLAIQSAVGLKVALAESEIDLKVKEKSLSPNHPDVIALRRKIEEIKGQILALENGTGDGSILSLPVASVPALRIKLAELTGRVKEAEALYQTLSQQLENVKIQEKMDTPTISVLDMAYPPDLPYRPQKTRIVLASTAGAVFLAIFLALFLNYLSNLKKNSPDDYNRAKTFFNVFLGWLPGISRKNSAS